MYGTGVPLGVMATVTLTLNLTQVPLLTKSKQEEEIPGNEVYLGCQRCLTREDRSIYFSTSFFSWFRCGI